MDDNKKKQRVYVLLVQVGRKTGDGLPKEATGGALLCYSSGVNENEAVREAVAILKQADMAVLEVQGHGAYENQEKNGTHFTKDDKALAQRALKENAVIVAQVMPFYD